MVNYETYQTTPSKNGEGIFFFTDCGNRMYYIDNDDMKYHKCICPKCRKTLLLRGTPEATKFIKEKIRRIKKEG